MELKGATLSTEQAVERCGIFTEKTSQRSMASGKFVATLFEKTKLSYILIDRKPQLPVLSILVFSSNRAVA